jgi:hypothetical protein
VRSSEDKNPDDLKRRLDEAGAKVRALVFNDSWFRQLLDTTTPAGTGLVLSRAEEYAKLIGRSASISADDAVKAAKAYVEKTMLQVNGSAITGLPNLSNEDTRTQLEKQLTTLLPSIQQRPSYKGMSMGDLGIQQGPDSSFRLIDKRTWMPIMLPTIDGAGNRTTGEVLISPKQLLDGAAADQRAKQAAMKQDQQDNARKAFLNANPLDLTPEQREQRRGLQEEDRAARKAAIGAGLDKLKDAAAAVGGAIASVPGKAVDAGKAALDAMAASNAEMNRRAEARKQARKDMLNEMRRGQ